jgi:hypothetical protein
LLGLQKRVGSLEVGKDGNVLLFSGDPLLVTSFVEHVIVEGQPVYDRSKDIRVKALLEGRLPPGTAAAAEDGSKITDLTAAKPHDDTGTVPQDEPEPKKKD